jgi:undecaprenyl diphosphate synthase
LARSTGSDSLKTQKDGAGSSCKDDLQAPLKHVAIIMDGNRRWAKKNNLEKLLGHKAGVKTLKKIVKRSRAIGLKYLTVYAFSSENWQREKEEVDYLFELFAQVLKTELDELAQNGVCLSFIGDLDAIPDSLRKSIEKAYEKTKNNSELNLQIAINYGSRAEITKAVQKLCKDAQNNPTAIENISEDAISSYLYTQNIPDPDLIIRTGGEMRLSNFLLWQAAYSELYVTETMWPDFDAEDFDKAIDEYTNRQRRYGG